MRKAQISELQSQPTEEVKWLRQARVGCNEPVAALVALLAFHQREGLSESELKGVRRELVGTLENSAGAPPAVLSHIARADDVEGPVLRAALGLVERRLADEEAEDRARFVKLSAVLNGRLGRSEEVITALRELRILEPGNEVAGHALVRSLEASARWSESADVLAGMIETGGPYLRSRLARALARAGRLTEAQQQLEILEEVWNDGGTMARLDFAGVVLAAAWNLRDAGRAEDAEGLFQRAAEFAPHESWAAVEAAGALTHLYGTTEERAALRENERRRFEQEADGPALLNEGARLLSIGSFDEAIELFRRASEELGHLEAVWYNLGLAAYRAERWEGAVEALDRAAQLNGERADNVFFGGLALVQLRRWEEAIPRFLRSLELDPGRGHAHYNLWVCYRSLGRDAEAAVHYEAYKASQQ